MMTETGVCNTVESKILTLFSDISAVPVSWLWQPYIALGKITLLQGDPGCGKQKEGDRGHRDQEIVLKGRQVLFPHITAALARDLDDRVIGRRKRSPDRDDGLCAGPARADLDGEHGPRSVRERRLRQGT